MSCVLVTSTLSKPTQDMMLAQYKTDPRVHPHLVRRQDDVGEEATGQTRQKRKIIVRTKTPIKEEVISKPQPLLVGRQEFLFGPTVTTTTTTAPATAASTTATASVSPLSWIASYFPSNLFSFSPMSLFGGDRVFGNVVLNSEMGPHFLLR